MVRRLGPPSQGYYYGNRNTEELQREDEAREYHNRNMETQTIPITVINERSDATFFVGDFLKKNYMEMSNKLEIKHECSICLENICCPKCFTLLTCGHVFCLFCITRCDPLCCPLCRQKGVQQPN